MTYDLTLGVLLLLGSVGAAGVLGLALAAFRRRRSRAHLLIALALATLFARTTAGVGYAGGGLSPQRHHLLEHGLDVLMAALVIAAVVGVGAVSRSSGSEAR